MEYWGGLERLPEAAPKRVDANGAVAMVADDRAGDLATQLAARASLARERDRFDETPLMVAIRMGRWDCAKACAAHADWLAQTPRGATTLAALAAKMGPEEERPVRVLVSEAMLAGADPDERGFDGVSAREAAQARGALWAQRIWGEPKKVAEPMEDESAPSSDSEESFASQEGGEEELLKDFAARAAKFRERVGAPAKEGKLPAAKMKA